MVALALAAMAAASVIMAVALAPGTLSGARPASFVEMKNDAEIVERRALGEVDIGARVTIVDAETGESRSFTVGSYQILDQQHENEISYAPRSPSRSWAPPWAKSGRSRSATGGRCSAWSASSSTQEP
jgi:hypothetical protein